MHAMYEVFGLIEDPNEVDSTVADLVQHGVPSHEVDVLDAAPGIYRIADEHLHDDVMGTARGAAVGAAAGMLIALLVVWAMPGLDAAGGAQWALGLFFMGVMGAVVGGMAGLANSEDLSDDEVHDIAVAEGSGLRILAIRSDRWHARAHRVMENHRVTFLDEAIPHA